MNPLELHKTTTDTYIYQVLKQINIELHTCWSDHTKGEWMNDWEASSAHTIFALHQMVCTHAVGLHLLSLCACCRRADGYGFAGYKEYKQVNVLR